MSVIQLSGLYDEKWRQDGYQKRTIGKAQAAKESAAKTPQRDHVPTRLQVQSAQSLASESIAPVRWVVPGLIAEGLTLLVGGAKVGKSWAVLGIGLAVATGGRVF